MRSMNIVYFSNEFPKEDLQDLLRRIHNHSRSRQHPLLAQFLDEATAVVKAEIQQLATELKQIIPPFTTLLSWAENTELRQGLLCGAIDGVLLVLVQLAAYIGYAEHADKAHLDLGDTSITGLGIGLLASTALALSPELGQLPLAGANAVRLAFRMGVHVTSVAEDLESRDLSEKPDTWAYVIHDVDPEAVQSQLDNANHRVPETAKIFLSAFSRTSVTVSGPPARLKALFSTTNFFRKSRFIELPVYGGLCHASHVYGPEDTQKIIQGESLLNSSRASYRPIAPIYSTSTGKPFSASTSEELYACVVSELLTKAICWDKVVRGVADQMEFAVLGEADVQLFGFGNSLPMNDLQTALRENASGIDVSMDNFISWIVQVTPSYSTPRGTAQSKLAIVGMSCRLPGGATNTEKFWEVLEAGLDVSRRIPADRFDIDTHYDPTGKALNKTMTQYGCFIDEPGMFDAPFFNMSPREAQVVDPQMRLSLVTAYEALERSGYVGNRTASTQLQRIGTFYGQAADDYREVNQGQEVNTYYIPGGCRAFGPGRINYFFKFGGPSYSIDTACSSGLAAVEVACQALWKGEVDTAIAGGVNLLTNPDGFAGLCNGHFLTKGHNACKTWDASADGYCRADGVGSIVIKRLEDAEADNDNILGVVLAAGTNHSADAVSITHPHAGNQAYLSRQVLRQAGVNPLDVSYVELHGTGTQAGDFEEVSGILDVYAPALRRRTKDQPLHIGAVKANMGHGESAAGITALIKVLLMLEKNAVPRHIGIKTEINPKFPTDLNKRNVHIPFEMKAWPKAQPNGKNRIAVVNNFGAAGGNTTLLLEDAPSREKEQADPRQTHTVVVSAKTKASLSGNIESLISYLNTHPDVDVADLSYTTTARRYHHSFRVAFTTSDVQHAKKQLTSSLAQVDQTKPVGKTHPPQVAFTFTGQGASHQSMNLELYRDVPTFRDSLQQLDSLSQRQGFPSFLPAVDGSHHQDYVHPPVITQLGLVCTEIATAKYWASLGVKPDIVIGHSLGEYAAMHVAGVITASDAIFMVGRRAELLQEKCQIGSHAMLAVRASLEQIEQHTDGKQTIACINGPSSTVLSGTKDLMESTKATLEVAGMSCIMLDVAFAFHSEQTDPILGEFEAISKGVIFSEPKLPFISPLLRKVIFDGKTLNANYVRRATRESVGFMPALENALDTSAIGEETIWIEIGPHPVCAGFVKATIPATKHALASLRRGESNWKTMAGTMTALHLLGVPLGWNEFHRPFERPGGLQLLDLPTYAFSDKNYWLQYNGDWCLTKGNKFYVGEKEVKASVAVPKIPMKSEDQTSTVQQIIELTVDGSAGRAVMQADLMQADFLAAANGHRMNNCGVVTSSIHADIAYTLGRYLCRQLKRTVQSANMNIANLAVTKGLVAQSSKAKTPQLIEVAVATANIDTDVMDLTWQTVSNAGERETFATANIVLGDASSWMASWAPITHLVRDRIEALEHLAAEGKANRFSRNMAYTLFASNLVNYDDKYRGMQSVVMHELEGFANIQLTTKESGAWTVPPYFIDSVAHLAGFIMNCSDAMDAANNYSVTPGWDSMQFAAPLLPGAKYCSYVKMIPDKGEANSYLGDVYILQDDEIIGKVGGIKFHSYPRILLDRFFSPPDKALTAGGTTKKVSAVQTQAPISAKSTTTAPGASAVGGGVAKSAASPAPAPAPAPVLVVLPSSAPSTNIQPAAPAAETTTTKALELIAAEGGMEVSDLEDESSFADLGVDSLLSLVISEKFRTELGVQVGGSLFLDYPTIGDLKKWLDDFYG
ncbi:Non-reducing polyketide synthase PKS8-1 [Ascochyta lentis]